MANQKPNTPGNATKTSDENPSEQDDVVKIEAPAKRKRKPRNKKTVAVKPLRVKGPDDGVKGRKNYNVTVRGGPDGHQHDRPLVVEAIDQQEAILFTCKALQIEKTHAYNFSVARAT